MEKTFFNQRGFLLALIFGVAFLAGACDRINFGRQVKDQAEGQKTVPAGQVAMLENSIIVTNPFADETITSPATITGKVLLQADKVYFRIFDDWGNLMATSSAEVLAESSNYSATINFPVPYTPKGTIQAYTSSEDGQAERNLIQIPVNFKEYKIPKIKVYFSNIKNDPELKDCQAVYPVERSIVINDQLVNNVLQELFRGLSEEEMKAGFVSNFPEGEIRINKLDFANGVATLDFSSSTVKDVKNECRAKAIVSQITQTLKQFGDIKEVKLLIEGIDINTIKFK